MTKQFWNVLKFSPLVLAATFCAANSALAESASQPTTSVNQLSSNKSSSEENLGQVTSVSQFSDVQPTDWAFQALQSLVERYGCIAGYPNGTYRGNRAMTRYEFAAGLNACLDRVNELIATATADLVRKEDLATLQRLQEEFSAELATLRGRVDTLEARTAQLEANQFSTTTKLIGEAVFALSNVFGDTRAVNNRVLRTTPLGGRPNTPLDSNYTFSDRVRLSLNSSFTGKDVLQVRIQAGNVFNNNSSALANTNAQTGTSMTRLAFDGFDSNTPSANNSVFIDKINYAFDLGSVLRVKVDANQGEFWENINNFNPDFASSGRGALSRYGRFSPIYRQGQGGAGATIILNPTGPITVSAGYLAGGRNFFQSNPGFKGGLFEGNYAAIAQVSLKPSKVFNIAATYARSYQTPANGSTTVGQNNVNPNGVNLFEGTGSFLANQPFGNVATTANHYGVEATFSPSPKIVLAGWGGYTTAYARVRGTFTPGGGTLIRDGDQADAYYWGASLSLKDFARQGNVLGFIVGTPPTLSYNSLRFAANGREQRDVDTSYHLEGLYKFQVNDNISITPGVLVIINPENNTRNPTEYVGTVRTTFTF